MPRLRRSSCAAPGFSRRRRGRGFEYLDPGGERVEDPAVLERIAELVIPPAWREVWICMDPLGHLQATGFDDAGRKQYLYHEHWRTHRDRIKFDDMIRFGEALPRLRRRVARDLRVTSVRDGRARAGDVELSPARVLACAVRLLDLGCFRIGSAEYADTNDSYGLTTLRREHVTIDASKLIFDFPAKSGRRQSQAIADPPARRVVAALKRRRSGAQLLAYRDGGRWAEVNPAEVNAYIKEHAGGDFSAKDFRTWSATVLAAVTLADGGEPDSRAGRARHVRAAVEAVADYLGNTPAVCRASYIDPRVIDRYEAGVTIAPALERLRSRARSDSSVRAAVEEAVIGLLSDNGARRARAA